MNNKVKFGLFRNTMDQKKHWNTIASQYEDEIFDVFKNDKFKKLPKYFQRHGNVLKTAIDFGCGVGKAFEYMSPLFKSILATDISDECIAIAKGKGYSNISFKQADLTDTEIRFPKADFAFCCNVIMLPEINKNFNMIINIRKSLKPGGTALIIVPAVESALLSSTRLIEWYERSGVKRNQIPAEEFGYIKSKKTDLVQGLIDIDGVSTKHYTAAELQLVFDKAKLSITSLDKIEYDWQSEFSSPPKWMQAPYAWDWLIECKNETRNV